MKTIVKFILITLCLSGCDTIDDPNKIDPDYQYQGSFSIVVGQSFINLKDMSITLDPNWQIFPDSLLRLVDTIKFRDAIPFDLTGIVGPKTYVKSLLFKGNATNQFPTNEQITFSFADQNKIPVDSLDAYCISINSATFVNDSAVKDYGAAAISIPVNQKVFIKWDEIKYLLIEGKLINNITKFSQFGYYPQFRININLAVRVDFDFNLNDLKNSK